MKTKGLIIVFLFLTGWLSAQEDASGKKYYTNDKESRKLEKMAKLQEEYNATSLMLDSMNFVLESNYLSNSRGYRSNVTSTLNFIRVKKQKTVIQTGNDSRIGMNGVGGATAEGTISNWKLTKNEKRKSFSVSWNVMSNLGMYSILMDVTASGRASATLTGMGPGRLIFDGYLVSDQKSRVYKGMSGY
jgi:hypothetical protein